MSIGWETGFFIIFRLRVAHEPVALNLTFPMLDEKRIDINKEGQE